MNQRTQCVCGICAIFLITKCHSFFRSLNFKLKMIGALLHCLCFLLLVNRDLGAPQFDTRSKCFPLCVEKIFLIKLFLFFIEHFKDLFSTKTYHNRLISLSACLRVKWAVPEDSPRVLIQTTSPFSPSTQDL